MATRQRPFAGRSSRAARKLPVSATASDAYLNLVRPFPLTPIRDDARLAEAVKVIDYLLRCDLDAGQQDHLDVLTDLVESYEDEPGVFMRAGDLARSGARQQD